MNNPLRFVDPSGYLPLEVMHITDTPITMPSLPTFTFNTNFYLPGYVAPIIDLSGFNSNASPLSVAQYEYAETAKDFWEEINAERAALLTPEGLTELQINAVVGSTNVSGGYGFYVAQVNADLLGSSGGFAIESGGLLIDAQEGVGDGFSQYFKDQKTFLTHLDNLSGGNGADAQQAAELRNGILIESIRAYVNDGAIPLNGEMVSIRDLAHSQLLSSIQNNSGYFFGRQVANTLTTGVLSAPFAKGGPILGAGAMLTFGGSLTLTSGLGAGVRLIDSGISDPVSVLTAIGGGL
ncbi:MAG: hypothetical protein V3T17_11635 [Pseudomonadales bacterium]